MELILIRGLPGSGKTTYAKKMYPNHLHFEADMYFERDGAYNWDHTKIAAAHKWCLDRTISALAHHQNVVVSNTFTQMRELDPYLQLAMISNIKPTIIEMCTMYGSVHNVPQATIDKMFNRWESSEDVLNIVKEATIIRV